MRQQLVDFKTVITRLCSRYLDLDALVRRVKKLETELAAARGEHEETGKNCALVDEGDRPRTYTVRQLRHLLKLTRGLTKKQSDANIQAIKDDYGIEDGEEG